MRVVLVDNFMKQRGGVRILAKLHKLFRALMKLLARGKAIHCDRALYPVADHVVLNQKTAVTCGTEADLAIGAHLQTASTVWAFVLF